MWDEIKEALVVVVVVGGLPGANLATRVPEGVAERDQNLDASLLRNIRLGREIIQDTCLRLMATYAYVQERLQIYKAIVSAQQRRLYQFNATLAPYETIFTNSRQ
jgi:hypothetical protein